MLIPTQQNTVARNSFRRLLKMGTRARWRLNSDAAILKPTFQILVTNLHSHRQTAVSGSGIVLQDFCFHAPG